MAEALGAAATIISIVGFSAQAFDGCVKGFVLLSTAQNLGRDADILRSMLEWEQFRLEQWGEKVGLQDPAKADILMDWKLIENTLVHLRNLITDTEALKKKYNLELTEQVSTVAPDEGEKTSNNGDQQDKLSKSRFKRLFGQNKASSAAAKVIQSKNNAPKKLWWAAVDKQDFQNLVKDIAHFVQRLHDSLSLTMQAQMQKQMDTLLHDGVHRSENVYDLEFLRELAAHLRKEPPGYKEEDERTESVADEIDRGLRNLLFHSIARGEVEEVEALLDKGLDIHCENRVGWGTMIVAADHGQLRVAEVLLQRGADPTKGTIGYRRPLHFAAEHGHEGIVRLLLDQPLVDINARDHTGQTALFKAADNGRHEVVTLLLQQPNINPNETSDQGFTPLLQTVFNRHTEVIRLLLARGDVDPNRADTANGQTPLWMAATTTDEILQMMLDREDIRINKPGRWGKTPLYQAVQHGTVTAAQMLLKAGADPNIPSEDEITPLIIVVTQGREEHLELLLAQTGINIDDQNIVGDSALHLACLNGNAKLIRILLAHSPPPHIEAKNKEGRTPLHLAAENGHKVAAKLLLKAKAVIDAQDSKGNTPLSLAAVAGHDAVARFLLESGADPEVADEDEETPLEKARDKHLDTIISVFKEMKV